MIIPVLPAPFKGVGRTFSFPACPKGCKKYNNNVFNMLATYPLNSFTLQGMNLSVGYRF